MSGPRLDLPDGNNDGQKAAVLRQFVPNAGIPTDLSQAQPASLAFTSSSATELVLLCIRLVRLRIFSQIFFCASVIV
jgi:hypothetical protein